MRTLLKVTALTLALSAGVASAQERITRVEAANLMRAMAALGCSGGRISIEDRQYEVSDVLCRDGRTYVLTFGPNFELLEKVED
jgi:hypothetical protein